MSDTQRLQRPDVGTIVNLTGGDGVLPSMPKMIYLLLNVQRSRNRPRGPQIEKLHNIKRMSKKTRAAKNLC